MQRLGPPPPQYARPGGGNKRMQLTSPETTPIKNKSPVVCDLTSPTDGINDSDWEDAELQRSLFPEEVKNNVNEESGEP